MRLGKWFVLAALVVVTLSTGMAWAQPKSDSDFIYMVPANININPRPAADTTFLWACWINNKTVLGAVALPFVYTAPLAIDTSGGILIPPDVKGYTLGAAGRNAGWTIKTGLTQPAVPGILCGFISFTSFPPTNDTLLYLHFKVTGGVGSVVVDVDTGLVNGQRVAITDVLAQDQKPTWTKGTMSLGIIGIGGHDAGVTPLTYGLNQNLPNPFNAQTKISFSMPVASHVKLIVYNVLGQDVVTLLDQKMDAAKHEVIWDGYNAQGSPVASGTYFYRLNIGDSYEETRQMTLLK